MVLIRIKSSAKLLEKEMLPYLKFPNIHLWSAGRKIEKYHQNVSVHKEKSSCKHVSLSETLK